MLGAQVAAWGILAMAVTCGERDKGCIVFSNSALEVTVGAALQPPTDQESEEAMRVLCLLTRGYHCGYEIAGESDINIPDALGSPADLAPNPPAGHLPNISAGLAQGILGEMVRLGAAKAAIAHFKNFRAPPAPGDCKFSGLDRGALAKFLCRISWAKGVLARLQDNGGLQILVNLLRFGEENERKHALEAITLLAYTEPAARFHLRAVGVITHLGAQLKVSLRLPYNFVMAQLNLCTATKIMTEIMLWRH